MPSLGPLQPGNVRGLKKNEYSDFIVALIFCGMNGHQSCFTFTIILDLEKKKIFCENWFNAKKL